MVAEGFAAEPGLGAEPGVPLCLTTGDFWLLGVVTGPSLGDDELPLLAPTPAPAPVAEAPAAAVLLVGLVAVAVVLLPLVTVVAPAHAPPDVPFTMGDDVTAVIEVVPVVVLAP